ncbi:MAG TPA: ATP-binding protein [Acidimicrobiales bacterium]|nr:ATP-binding protein [Acidimicrobiales bacterium]
MGGAPDTERRAEALLRALVTSPDIAVVTLDPDGVVVEWGPTAATMFGHAAADAEGRPFDALAPLAGGGDAHADPGYVEQRRVRADGTTLTVGTTAATVTDARGAPAGSVLVMRDVSDRLAAEAALADAHRELEERNAALRRSNSELEQFASVASHDLSEPLRAVSGMVELLARRYAGRLDGDADEFIGFAVDGCRRMRSLIDGLLAYSRVGRAELRPQPVDLAEVLATVASSLRAQPGFTSTTLRWHDLPVVTADRAQLTSVMQNLVSNAVKFVAPGVEPEVEVAARAGDGCWHIAVSDNGVGIEPRFRERIFGMFQRLHPADEYAGTGIGLTLCQRIVERHGGTIVVGDSALGGTCVEFTLPS